MEIDTPQTNETKRSKSEKRYETRKKQTFKKDEDGDVCVTKHSNSTQTQATPQPLPPQPPPSPRQVQNAIIHQRSTISTRAPAIKRDAESLAVSTIQIPENRAISSEPVIEKRITRSMKKESDSLSYKQINNSNINNINTKVPLQPVIEIQWREEIQISNEVDDYVPTETQICYDCGSEKSLSAFKSRRRNICIECQVKKEREMQRARQIQQRDEKLIELIMTGDYDLEKWEKRQARKRKKDLGKPQDESDESDQQSEKEANSKKVIPNKKKNKLEKVKKQKVIDEKKRKNF